MYSNRDVIPFQKPKINWYKDYVVKNDSQPLHKKQLTNKPRIVSSILRIR